MIRSFPTPFFRRTASGASKTAIIISTSLLSTVFASLVLSRQLIAYSTPDTCCPFISWLPRASEFNGPGLAILAEYRCAN
jgi:hypothetical protein